jgi:hypothetical protein
VPATVTDETFLTSARAPSRAQNLYARGEDSCDDSAVPPQVWTGLLGEFRNQLARLSAGAVQVRDALPIHLGADLAPALSDIEASLDGLSGLVSSLGAVTAPGEQVISDLSDVIDRALTMAGPWLPSDLHVTVGSRVGAVRNRSRAVEGALAAAVVALASAPDSRPGPVLRELHIEVFAGRGAVVIEVETPGDRSSRPSSWRWLLAERLAAVAGGTLENLPDKVGVGLRFQ